MNALKICAAALVASLGLAATSVHAAAPCTTDKSLEASKKLVATALDAFFNKRDASAVAKYIGAEYPQHNPHVADGPDGLTALIGALQSGAKFELGTQAAHGDLVWTHGRYTGVPGMNTSVIVDIFRVKDGKLVEHWDIAQTDVPAAQTASGRPMFPIQSSAPAPVFRGCGKSDDAPCVSEQELEANKKLVATALDAYFNKRDVSAVDKHIGTEYLQHNPSVKDGSDGLKAFIGMLKDDSKFELGTQVAEGDLVWTHGRYTGIPGHKPTVIVDIFRVKDGKLVEHWDIAQEDVPAAQTASGRPMFPLEA